MYSTFAKHKDIGIAEYVRDIKIKKATELLKNGDLSIKEIAYLTGFTDSNHFIKIFRLYNYLVSTIVGSLFSYSLVRCRLGSTICLVSN